MPRLSLGLGVSSSSKLPQGRAAPPGIPLNSSTITLNFPSAVHGSSRSFSSGNYSLSRLDNSQWRTSGQGPLTPGFYSGLGLTYNANWPQSYGGFPEGNNKWVVYNGYNDEGSAYMDILYYHPTANSTSIPVNGWLLGSFYGTPTTGGDLTITAPTFPNVATTNVVNALINTSDAATTSYLQSLGFTAVGGVFSVPLTKQVPPSQNYLSVEYKTTFNDGATCDLIHSAAANNRWFFFMRKFAYYDEEFGNQYDILIGISTTTGQSNATIPAARSSWSGTNINSMVSPNCFS